MSEISQVITQILNHPVFALVIIFLALLLILHLNRARIVKNWLNFNTRRLLNRLGLDQISNIRCPDGLGHHFAIDRVILRPDGISLLVVKNYPGKIFCSDHIEHWSQMLGQKSYPFANPLYELDYQVKAFSDYVSTNQVDGYLFFDHHATFPKGHPDRVIHPKNIPETLNVSAKEPVNADTMLTWEKIKAMACAK